MLVVASGSVALAVMPTFKPVGEFSSTTLAALVGPVFDKIAASLVDAFVKRAEAVYE